MSGAPLLPAWFGLAAVASAFLTYAWIAFATRRQLMDLPGARRLHDQPTPRGGGIGIAVLVIAAFAWISMPSPGLDSMARVSAGVAMFAALGLLDDVRPLPAFGKLAIQLIAAALLVSAVPLPATYAWLAWPVAVLACAYTVNIFNFMDGSNGLVATQGLVIAVALSLWPGQVDTLRLVAAVLAGACVGFLPFNLPRPRVFLGDVGSHAIGASIFALLVLSWTASVLGLAQCLLFATPVLLDTGYTLLRRARAGRAVWKAHREHAYQYAVRQGHSHTEVCVFYGAWTTLSVALAASGLFFRSSLVMWALFTLHWAVGTVLYCRMRRHWLTARMRRGIPRE